MSRKSWLCAVLLLDSAITASAQQLTLTGRIELASEAGRGRPGDAANVVVWLTPVAGAAPANEPPPPPPPQHFRLLQKSKKFEPHVLVIAEGTAVEFPNADPFFHNVFSLFEGKRFDLGLYEAGSTRAVRFDRLGISYIFCNIHPEMSAVVVVLKTPYYGVSDRAGRITIPNVPTGNYLLRVWDEGSLPEELQSLSREIGVSDRNRSLGTIRLVRSNRLPLPHKNKYGRDYDKPTPANPVYRQP